MTREITDVLSTGIDIYNCVICLVMMISTFRNIKKRKASRYFFLVSLCVLIFNIGDMANWISEGTTPWIKIPYLRINTFLFYFIVPFTFLFLIRYIREYIKPNKMNPIFFKVSCITSAPYLILSLLSPFFNIFYTFTEDNHYVRGKLHLIAFIFYAVFYFISVWTVLGNKKYFKFKSLIAFISFSLLPTLAEIIQIFNYGLCLTNTGMTLSILLIFINSHIDLEHNYEAQSTEIKNTEKKLIKYQEHTINNLANLVEERDSTTGEHIQRTSIFVEELAVQAQKNGLYPDELTDDFIKTIVKAAPLHDIGKIVIPDSILKKPGPLTDDEREIMRTHTVEGGRIAQDIVFFSESVDYINATVDIAKYHHEKWDGTGYPEKLKGKEIPLSARIMAIADVFDALVFSRCYRPKPFTIEQAYEIITDGSGTHFEPELVDAFVQIKDKVSRLVPILPETMPNPPEELLDSAE